METKNELATMHLCLTNKRSVIQKHDMLMDAKEGSYVLCMLQYDRLQAAQYKESAFTQEESSRQTRVCETAVPALRGTPLALSTCVHFAENGTAPSLENPYNILHNVPCTNLGIQK